MNNSSIRAAKQRDLDSIKAIINATELFPSEYLDDMFSVPSDGSDAQDFWFVFDNGKPLAVAYCAPEPMTERAWNVLLMAVHPDHQGNGIGKLMMSHVEETLSTRDARLLIVETSGTMLFANARKFYDRIGYESEGRIRDYYAAGDDKIIFRKVL